MEYPPDKGGVGRYLESIVTEVGNTEVVRPKFFRFFWPRWFKAIVTPFVVSPSELWVSHLLPLGYVALLYKVITGIPYTIFVHGTDVHFASKNIWKHFWAKMILSQAGQIIANSRYTLSLITKLKIKNLKLEVVYPCPTFHPTDMPLDKKPYSFLSVGRLVPRKGFDSGIGAAVQLKKEFPDLTYTIIGNGSEQKKLEDLILKNNAGSYIKIITNATDETLKQYYIESGILLAPGQEIDGDVEGFGLVILEAAQFGTPAVATNIGGVGEAIINGQTGVLILNNNTDTVVGAVKKLLYDDEYRQHLGQQAKDRVRQNFVMGEQTKKIF